GSEVGADGALFDDRQLRGQGDAAVTELKTLANPISTGLSAGQSDLAVTANGATITVGFSPAGIYANVDNAVQQSLEVIRQRVDQVGVS
ncbi:hypothetical protein ACC760_38335, partial [Rhizobium ruizarguesonis]